MCRKHSPKGPLFISWEIISDCNLSCKHCRAAFNCSRNIHNSLPIEKYRRVIQDFGTNEVHRIGITGGEPFLHPYFFDILSACKKEGIDLILYTNATLINDRMVDSLSQILSKYDIVHVSLDGGDARTNDSQRGPGAFVRAINGIELLSKHNINIRINVVPTIFNENSLLKLCDIAIKCGVKEFGASPLMTIGRASLSRIAPDYQKLFETEMQIVNKLKESGVKYIGGISGAVHNYLNIPDLFKKNIFTLSRDSNLRKICDAGNRKIFIDAVGNVFPCSLFAANSQFSIGNIFDSSLNEIWHRDKWSIFRKGIPISSSKCKNCPLLSLCNGGCMALAYQATGQLGDMDPRCPNKKSI